MEWADELLSEVNDFIADQEDMKRGLQTELNDWKHTRDDAATFLAEAEESRARQALAVKDAEFESFKDEYNVMKSEYDELYGYDMAGTITETQFERMLELEALYYEDQEIYEQFERERVESLRANQEKEYNNAKMAVERLRADVVAIEREQTEQQEHIADQQEIVDQLVIDIAQLKQDVKSLKGTEKDDMKAYIKDQEFNEANAELAMNAGNRELNAIGDRLSTA